MTTDGDPGGEPVSPPLLRDRSNLSAAALIAVGLLIIGAAGWWVTNSRVFDMRTLTVTGNKELSVQRVAEIAGLGKGTNVLWFRPGSVERRLEADPWILSASVTRTLPTTLSVTVTERSPVASVGSHPTYLVSGDGMILGPAAKGQRLPLLVTAMPNLRPGTRIRVGTPALVVARSIPVQLRPKVQQIQTAGTTVNLQLRNGVHVFFGDTEQAAQKGAALMAVLDWARIRGVRTDYIDVRAPGAPALKPYVPPPPPAPVVQAPPVVIHPSPAPQHSPAPATPSPAPAAATPSPSPSPAKT